MRGHFHIDFVNNEDHSQMRVETAASEVTQQDAVLMLDAFMGAFGLSTQDIVFMLALRESGVLGDIIDSKTHIELPSHLFEKDN